jgi:16S rRNA (guanine527-N7)-methyltransferase
VDRSSEFLAEARLQGLLGPGPLEVHLWHSEAFVEALRRAWSLPERTFDLAFTPGSNGGAIDLLDLGSGGGVPGMIIAELWPASTVTLLDSSKRRCALLSEWAAQVGSSSRVEVLCGRAEELGRDPELRGRFDAVVARSFGRPSVTAECAAPFLRVDGLLVVSDPPTADEEPTVNPGAEGSRWSEDGLAKLGLEPLLKVTDPFHFTILKQSEICPDRYPRRTGIPAKRPLF